MLIENLNLLRNDNLLSSTLKSPGLLSTLDPTAAKPEPRQLASFSNETTRLSGIVRLGNDLIAIIRGLHTSLACKRGSVHLFIV